MLAKYCTCIQYVTMKIWQQRIFKGNVKKGGLNTNMRSFLTFDWWIVRFMQASLGLPHILTDVVVNYIVDPLAHKYTYVLETVSHKRNEQQHQPLHQ